MNPISAVFEGKSACFFVKTKDPSILERNEFYRVDLDILDDLGLTTTIVTDIRHIKKADVYVVWWWTWAFIPLLQAKLLGKPVIIVGAFDHVMPDGKFQIFPNRPLVQKALIRWALKAAKTNIVCSEDQRELMTRMFKSSPIEVIPQVLNTYLYAPADQAREPFFLTVCWMNKDNAIRKCVATSIRAMAAVHKQLPDHRLIIVGDKGDGYPVLAELVKELNAEAFVEFSGVISQSEKIDLMQRCTAYLQPTLAEGFGVAILEAMSCGAPVIVSPVGAVPSVVSECALFVDGMDPNGLADAMHNLTTDAALGAQLSLQGRARAVKEFSYSRRLGDFRRILTSAMQVRS